jgi:hypothetical protein
MIVADDRVAPRTPLRGAAAAATGSQPEEAFARALREKGLAASDAEAGDDADGEDGASGNGSSQACPLACSIAPLAGLSGPAPAAVCEAGNDGDGPTASIEAAGSTTAASAAATAARSMLAPTGVDIDASAWEASIHDGNGVAVDLRAESAPPGPGQSAAWSVTVVSPALAAEILAQHAPDLTDRLRRRGIASRVQIDRALEDRGGEGEQAHAANPVRGVGSWHATDEST